MILERLEAYTRRCSKPRASGDDPVWRAEIMTSRSVNPARAGMIPMFEGASLGFERKPRASGDDPFVHAVRAPMPP